MVRTQSKISHASWFISAPYLIPPTNKCPICISNSLFIYVQSQLNCQLYIGIALFYLSIIKCQMSEEIQKWIRENFDLVDRIRKRFENYFRIQQSQRLSDHSNDQENVTGKIQNEWRKLNDLLNKDIPQRINKVDIKTDKNLELLRLQALRILNMFKNKFGQQKHNELKLLERTDSWSNPVFSSGLRNFKSQSKTIQYQLVPDQNESKVKSSIIQQAPGEDQEQMIKSLEEGDRRSSSRIMKVQAEQKRTRICGYILAGTLLLVLLMTFVKIPLKTKLFTYLFDNDL